jgi:hypothetical protein
MEDLIYMRRELTGLELIKFKGDICITVYNDRNYQIFYTEKCNAVYDKNDQKVYELTIDGWTRLVLKMESLLHDYHERSTELGMVL